jgi:hypothetical protein
METVNKDAKSLLAKMLATENIHVVHKKMPTAYFDTKNRELGLPILKEMNGDIYDLMTLHEVGHALWTDNDEWMKIVKNNNDDDLPKSFINITEDVRIERKIKAKYPGGLKSFLRGYSKLYKDDFFGTAHRDYETMNLADKINLHSKIGSLTGITFNEEETAIYDMCKDAVTFTHAVDAARAMYEYCKEHQEDFEDMDDDHEHMGQEWEESEDGEEREVQMSSSEKSEDDENSEENEESNSGGDGEKSVDESADGKDKNGSENSNPKEGGEETDETAPNGSVGGLGGMTNPIQAETVLEWENRKEDLNDDSGRDYWYANIPETDLNSIVDYKECMKSLSDWYVDGGMEKYTSRRDEELTNYDRAWIDAGYKYATKLEKDSMRTVNYLLKEFEMKKSADSYQRTSTARTGVLDMLKMHSYKYNEDVFKRISITPGDKNHGLVIFLDWSASMSIQHHNCFKQLLQIVWFCNRAGIKFEVYAFSDNGWKAFEDKFPKGGRGYDEPETSNTWKFKHNDMMLGDHLLMNLFSNRMSKRNLKKMVHYLTMTTFSITGNYTYDYRYGEKRNPITTFLPEEHHNAARYNGVLGVPEGWELGGTPLNGAIVNAMNFIPMYRTKNGIQNLNVVFITDGASNDNGNCKVDFNNDTPEYDQYNKYRNYPQGNAKTVYHDPITKKSYERSAFRGAGQVTTATLLTMLKDRTKCNVIGFFLAGTSGNNRVGQRDLQYMFPNQEVTALRKVLRKEKVLVCESMGYDEYYFVPGGQNLDIETEELKVNGDMTRGKMAKGFTNYMRGKTVNRVLLNKFVEQIA